MFTPGLDAQTETSHALFLALSNQCYQEYYNGEGEYRTTLYAVKNEPVKSYGIVQTGLGDSIVLIDD